jgi:Kdo2-lipid IVA lauroyltransferase/acyltransferase
MKSVGNFYSGEIHGGKVYRLKTEGNQDKEEGELVEPNYFAIRLVRSIPLRLRKIFAVALAYAFYHVSLKHRLIAIHNVARSFPGKPLKEIIQIAKGSYRSFALLAAEFCDITKLTRNNLAGYITITGLDHYAAACKKNKGVLLFGAHFGNWEMGNAALAITTKPFAFIYRVLDNSFLEKNITAVRASCGITSLSKEKAMRPMLRLLKKGETIHLLIDQNVAWYDGVFVDFFGRQACTTSGLALLALHTGAPVLPAFTHRLPDGKYLLEISREVEMIRSENRAEEIVSNTLNFNKIIEKQVRRHPEQWFWVHQRWKTRPCQAKHPDKKENPSYP